MRRPHQFTFDHFRVIAAGGAEAFPVDNEPIPGTREAYYWLLRRGDEDSEIEVYDSLLLHSVTENAEDVTYNVWVHTHHITSIDANPQTTNAWFILHSVTISHNQTVIVPLPHEGAYVCVLRSSVSTGWVKIMGQPKQTGASLALSSVSVPVAVTSSVPISILAGELAYQTVRTFTNTTADAEPPAVFTVLNSPTLYGSMEVKFGQMTFGGTVTASAATIKIWKRVGSDIDCIDIITYSKSEWEQAAGANRIFPRRYTLNADEVYATVTFPDGTSPNISGTVKMRSVNAIGLQRSDLAYDSATGLPKFLPASYDHLTDSTKVTPLYVAQDLNNPETLLIDTTGLIAGTEYYWASADGILMAPYTSITWEFTLKAGTNATDTIQYWWESTIGSNSWTQRNIITPSGMDPTSGAKLGALVFFTSPAGTTNGIVTFTNESTNIVRMRMVVKPITGNSRTVRLNVQRRCE